MLIFFIYFVFRHGLRYTFLNDVGLIIMLEGELRRRYGCVLVINIGKKCPKD